MRQLCSNTIKSGYWPWKEHLLASRKMKTGFMDVISLIERAKKTRTRTCLCLWNGQCESVHISLPSKRKLFNLGCNFYHACDFWNNTEPQWESCLYECPRSKTQEEQLNCQRLPPAVCFISVCSSAAAQKTELWAIACIRNTVMRRWMLSWSMSADPASEVSSLLLPNLVSTISLHLIALQSSFHLSLYH